MDSKSIGRSYPLFARNNTYSIELYPDEVFRQAIDLIDAPDTGCLALIDKCRALAAAGDLLGTGLNEEVNTACGSASQLCFGGIQALPAQFSSVSLV